MKTIPAGKFKDQCLKILDEVAAKKEPVRVTKRGRPVAHVVPPVEAAEERTSLAGSILKESGDPFSTSEEWDVDLS